MALLERVIRVTFKLGLGAFGDSGENQVSLEGHRVTARITKAGGPWLGRLSMSIYGLTPSVMDKLSTLGMAIQLVRRNGVVVEAGDTKNGVGTVFVGTIVDGYADFQASPEVGFHVEASSGYLESIQPAPSTSISGSADVATIMQGLATQMGLHFENNGVQATLSNPILYGAPAIQARTVAEHANIMMTIDNNSLIIWPRGQARGLQVPLVSADTGLVGYPAYTSKGILFRTLFNPNIGFAGKIQMQSKLNPANGPWIVNKLDHSLDANKPAGDWFTNVEAARPGLGPIVQQ